MPGKARLATHWAQATRGVTYYRCTLPARHLPGKVCHLNHGDVREIGSQIVFPRQEGAAIWSFSGNSTRAVLMSEMQEQGIPVLMELDDNYMVHPPFSEISMWAEKRSDPGASELGMHTYESCTDITRFCDGLIVSTSHLADVYRDVNPNVHVCPNSVDPDDWDPNPAHQQDGVLRVGWAASDSHRDDAPIIRDALAWASTQKNVEVVIMGIKPEFTRYRFKHTHVPWADSLAEYRRRLQVLDVMLCPIVPSFWADAKSDVKALEASLAGACSVVGETEPYRPWFDKPAYVAKHPWDWKKLLRHLVRNRDEVAETARLAREYVLAERQIKDNIHHWKEAISAASENRIRKGEALLVHPEGDRSREEGQEQGQEEEVAA